MSGSVLVPAIACTRHGLFVEINQEWGIVVTDVCKRRIQASSSKSNLFVQNNNLLFAPGRVGHFCRNALAILQLKNNGGLCIAYVVFLDCSFNMSLFWCGTRNVLLMF